MGGVNKRALFPLLETRPRQTGWDVTSLRLRGRGREKKKNKRSEKKRIVWDRDAMLAGDHDIGRDKENKVIYIIYTRYHLIVKTG